MAFQAGWLTDGGLISGSTFSRRSRVRRGGSCTILPAVASESGLSKLFQLDGFYVIAPPQGASVPSACLHQIWCATADESEVTRLNSAGLSAGFSGLVSLQRVFSGFSARFSAGVSVQLAQGVNPRSVSY